MRKASHVTPHTRPTNLDAFAGDVQYYLTLQPRQLPSRYFYDALGSALFEAICELPWYGVTRVETALLEAHAGRIFARAGRPSRVVELGSGSGEKLVLVLENRGDAAPVRVHLVDVSPSALASSSRAIGAIEGVEVVTHEAAYEAGLTEAMAWTEGPTLALFLGSNLGNFDRPAAEAFLRHVRASLARGDAFLVGTDLVKPEPQMLLAYDDPLGVTAAFNRNLLLRINRELGGNFRIDRFAHCAVWNEDESRIEMHLVSSERQRVRIRAADVDLTLEEGESIWTESSYKFHPDDIVERLAQTGFSLAEQWIDEEFGFALTLVRAA
jgi:L-histidine N-alpha-methyltransferase